MMILKASSVILLLSVTFVTSNKTPEDPLRRVDCAADVADKLDKQIACNQRECYYDESHADEDRDIPVCSLFKGQEKYSVKIIRNDPSGMILLLIRKGTFKDEPRVVNIEVTPLGNEIVRIKFLNVNRDRWETPLPELNFKGLTTGDPLVTIDATNGVLTITRISNKVVLFKSDLKVLFFRRDFMQIPIDVPNSAFYGLGENQSPFMKNVTDKKLHYAFLNWGGIQENFPAYGSHPFYVMFDQLNKEMHGFMVHSSNLMDITFRSNKLMTVRAVGGIFDFFLFLGPTPNDVLRQKGNLVPKAPMPPMWSLGFHLCRFGYYSLDKVKETTKRMEASLIPYDVQWFDIDFMSDYNMFTYDEKAFAGMPEFIDETHKKNRKVVIIVEPSLSNMEPESYEPFQRALKQDLLIKNEDGQNVLGRVWTSKSCVFLDYTKNETGDFWTDELKKFHQTIQFDGLWTDMNEPANFADEQLNPWTEKSCPPGDLNFPLYNKFLPDGQGVFNMSMCMSHQHEVGTHAEVHNIYAFYQTKQTYNALKAIKPKERPFVLSRGNHIGQGRYSNHWLGDVASTWYFLSNSIAQIMNFNLFGIPLVGSDICGFGMNTTVPLCSRWSALGAFYPFSRNHNNNDTTDQDPPVMGPGVVQSARVSLNYRYKLLPFLYTLFHQHTIDGSAVASSLMQHFYYDPEVLAIEDQFLWGSDFMVMPIVEDNTEVRNAYFPNGVWYLYEGLNQTDEGKYSVLVAHGPATHWKLLTCPYNDICVAHRGGSVIPVLVDKVMTTEEITPNSKFGFNAYLDIDDKAHGTFYFDDKSDDLHSQIVQVNMTVEGGNMTIRTNSSMMVNLHQVKIFGHTDFEFNQVQVDQLPIPKSDFSIEDNILTINLTKPLDLTEVHLITWRVIA